eukprot:TRINITY_DN28094_c0_g1_i2.p1 TRINITY_DN28094_c0_g1~~TRINITY_DN28094_c0_g1_i2.p1  ORF type:complete len:299 (-),score=46.79 TRINITY_DN28094_c0_g1_i2:116-934(-)
MSWPQKGSNQSGPPVPVDIASSFLAACSREYVDGVPMAVGDWLDAHIDSMAEAGSANLLEVEDQLREADDKAAFIRSVERAWGMVSSVAVAEDLAEDSRGVKDAGELSKMTPAEIASQKKERGRQADLQKVKSIDEVILKTKAFMPEGASRTSAEEALRVSQGDVQRAADYIEKQRQDSLVALRAARAPQGTRLSSQGGAAAAQPAAPPPAVAVTHVTAAPASADPVRLSWPVLWPAWGAVWRQFVWPSKAVEMHARFLNCGGHADVSMLWA